MATLTRQQISRTGLEPIFSAVDGDGDVAVNDDQTFVEFVNNGDNPIDVTIAAQKTDHGFPSGRNAALSDIVVEIPSGGRRKIAAAPEVYNNGSGQIEMTYETGFEAIAAAGSIEFSGNPSNGHTIALAGVTITFVTDSATGNQVNINVGGLSDTLDDLIAFLEAHETLDPLATYTKSGGDTLDIVHKTPGAAGNAYTLDASNATPSAETLEGGADISLLVGAFRA